MFQNREQAGKILAEKVKKVNVPGDSIVIGIPRGGVVVAQVVAQTLNLQLSVVVIKKIGAPGNPELAIGAVGPRRSVFWDQKLVSVVGISEKEKKELLQEKEKERKEKEELLGIKSPGVKDKTVIVVDDGVATGSTVIAAALFLRKVKAKYILLAVPVIAKDTLSAVKQYYDQILYLEAPSQFYAVGEFYQEFPQVEDAEVKEILKKIHR